jgi:hypothetical protein
LKETEDAVNAKPELNKARLGIIYHETALNLSLLSKMYVSKRLIPGK